MSKLSMHFHDLRYQVLRYTDDTFLDDEVGTIGADFKVKFIKVDKKNVKSMKLVCCDWQL